MENEETPITPSYTQFLEENNELLKNQVEELKSEVKTIKEEADVNIRNLLDYISEIEFTLQNKEDDLRKVWTSKEELSKINIKLKGDVDRLFTEIDVLEQKMAKTSIIHENQIKSKCSELEQFSEFFEQEKFFLNKKIRDQAEEITRLRNEKVELEMSMAKMDELQNDQIELWKMKSLKPVDFNNSRFNLARSSTQIPNLTKSSHRFKDQKKLLLEKSWLSGDLEEKDQEKNVKNDKNLLKNDEGNISGLQLKNLETICGRNTVESVDKSGNGSFFFENMDRYQMEHDIVFLTTQKNVSERVLNENKSIDSDGFDSDGDEKDENRRIYGLKPCKSILCFFKCILKKSYGM